MSYEITGDDAAGYAIEFVGTLGKVTSCPCCGKPFDTRAKAELTARNLRLLNSPPGYWMKETSGVLRPVVGAYLAGGEMTREQLGAMKAYCRQWINAPGFRGPKVETLRNLVNHIDSRVTLAAWLNQAEECGCDPL